jgi:hypothetical protein
MSACASRESLKESSKAKLVWSGLSVFLGLS